MALQKEITSQSGIIVNYHRIVSINKITNKCNIYASSSNNFTADNSITVVKVVGVR